MWVKFGLVLFIFLFVLVKIVVLIFFDGWRNLLGMIEFIWGLKFGVKVVGGFRFGRCENGILVVLLVIL